MAPTPGPYYNASILIIGVGTSGYPTALHLARRGYSNITVLNIYELHSPISAGNDINKIVEQGSFDTDTQNADSNYVSKTLLALATKGWLTDPVFTPYYHETGYTIRAHTQEGLKQLTKREMLDQKADFERLDTPEAFRATMPEGVLTEPFQGSNELKRGGEFTTGSKGNATKLLEEKGDITGVETADGTVYKADTTILAAGAQVPSLLDLKDQLRPTARTLALIKMSKEECALYKNLPVLFKIESGFFMESDEEKREFKICDEHPRYCNWSTSPGTKVIVPFAKHQIPKEAEVRVKEFLRDMMPSFARVCWCADAPDRNFLIDRHPEYKSLVLAIGGSGHGFCHITSVGGFVADVMEGILEKRLKNAFRWRPETAVGRDWSHVQNRRGGPNKVIDFGDMTEWTGVKPV